MTIWYQFNIQFLPKCTKIKCFIIHGKVVRFITQFSLTKSFASELYHPKFSFFYLVFTPRGSDHQLNCNYWFLFNSNINSYNYFQLLPLNVSIKIFRSPQFIKRSAKWKLPRSIVWNLFFTHMSCCMFCKFIFKVCSILAFKEEIVLNIDFY